MKDVGPWRNMPTGATAVKRSASTPSRSPGAPRQRYDTRTPHAHSYNTLAHSSPGHCPCRSRSHRKRGFGIAAEAPHTLTRRVCGACMTQPPSRQLGCTSRTSSATGCGLRAAPRGGEGREGSHPRAGATGPADGAPHTITVGETAACAHVKTQRYVTRAAAPVPCWPTLSPFQRHWLRLQLRCSSRTGWSRNEARQLRRWPAQLTTPGIVGFLPLRAF